MFARLSVRDSVNVYLCLLGFFMSIIYSLQRQSCSVLMFILEEQMKFSEGLKVNRKCSTNLRNAQQLGIFFLFMSMCICNRDGESDRLYRDRCIVLLVIVMGYESDIALSDS